MAIKRTIGIETEYGIMGGQAQAVLNGYKGKKKEQYNAGKTNESAVEGMTDIGGHHGGDYDSIDNQIEEEQGWFPGMGKTIRNVGRNIFHAVGLGYQHTGDIIKNGSRFYVDMGHPEYSTAESSNPRETVITDKAGEIIVHESAKNANENIKIYKNNTDGKGNSFGCHENYLISRIEDKRFGGELTDLLLPFFITRQIYTGSGKIGVETESKSSAFVWNVATRSWDSRTTEDSYKLQLESTYKEIEKLGKHFLDMGEDYKEIEKVLNALAGRREETGPQQVFQLSQRADFFTNRIGLQTTNNRPIMNTRDEPHADKKKYMRLHVINGDANMNEFATYLKVGTTALVLDLFEDKLMPQFDVVSPVKQFQDISLDQTRKWDVKLKDGKHSNAIDIQRTFFEAAVGAYSGRDIITDDILLKWGQTLDALESDPMQLFGKIDWVTKIGLVTNLMDSKGAMLTDTVIQNAALQYHDIDKNQGLFYYLQKNGMTERIVTDEEIAHAVINPPETTRAYLRGKASELDSVSKVDWGEFEIKAGKDTFTVTLKEPLAGTKEQVGEIFELEDPKSIVEAFKKAKGISCRKKTYSYSGIGYGYPGRYNGYGYGNRRSNYGFDTHNINGLDD